MSTDVNQELFKIITHLVNSASTSLGETPSLGAFRMVDAAHRLIALTEGSNALESEFLREAQEEYEAHSNFVMTDQPAFDAWLSEYAGLFTEEALRRARNRPEKPAN